MVSSPVLSALPALLGPRYSLRCVLFHDVSDTESSFTKGLGGTITRKELRGRAEVYHQTLHSRQLCKTFLRIPTVAGCRRGQCW